MKAQPADFRAEERSQTARKCYAYRVSHAGVAYFYTSLDADLVVENGPAAKMSPVQAFLKAPVAHSRPSESVDGEPPGVRVSLAASDRELRKFFLTVSPRVIDVDVWRVASSSLPGPVQYAAACRSVFVGVVDSVTFDDNTIHTDCLPKPGRQDTLIPRFNYQGVCNHVTYGPHCKLNRALFSTTVAVSAVSFAARTVDLPLTSISVDSPARLITITQETLEGGTIRDSAGEEMGVLSAAVLPGGAGVRCTVSWMARMLRAGDTVSVSVGCLHVKRVCHTLMHNLPNFGGQPYIPVNNPAVDGISA